MEALESRITTCVFPGKYVQGPGALGRLPAMVAALGGRALVVCGGAASLAVVERFVRPQLGDANATYTQLGGTPPEATRREIDRLTALARSFSATVVVAVGGGKGAQAVPQSPLPPPSPPSLSNKQHAWQ